ncbi:MAG: DUF2029 domain-containing protein [Planctomycetes bacterium]|nr:DUF2029 domain-containing protein [Planctomycetota bacterium]
MLQAGENIGYVIPQRFWAWIGTRRAVAVLLWLTAIGVGVFFLWHAFVWYNDPRRTPEEHRRADGNGGHVQIDFGGQWVMGRMVVLGHADELYHRQRQWEVVRASFPVEAESPAVRLESGIPKTARIIAKPDADLHHDSDNLMSWFMGRDPDEWKIIGGASVAPLGVDPFGNPFVTAALVQASADQVTPEIEAKVKEPAIGGPLYPPVHAFLYAPLALIESSQLAYHVFQVIGVLMVVVTGLGVKVLSKGRVPWSVATLVLFLFPGTRGGLDLAQNPTVSLAIVVWGWTLASRGYFVAGGMVWGLFAFKPVWGLAFFLVPVLTRRWRFCAAMVFTGCGLAAATLPFVGLRTWLEWLAVGREAAALYNVNLNWINLSRDVQSIPRRILHDFSLPESERDKPLTMALAWTLWGLLLGTTATVYLRFGDRKRLTGVGIAFLFFGAYLTCYRFMYYDTLLGAMGCAVLFADPSRFLRTRVFDLRLVPQSTPFATGRGLPSLASSSDVLGPRLMGYVCSFPLTMLVLLLLYENTVSGMHLEATFAYGYFARVTTGAGGATGVVMPKVQLDTGVNYPWETAMVFLLWLWCGWALIRGEERPTVSPS